MIKIWDRWATRDMWKAQRMEKFRVRVDRNHVINCMVVPKNDKNLKWKDICKFEGNEMLFLWVKVLLPMLTVLKTLRLAWFAICIIIGILGHHGWLA